MIMIFPAAWDVVLDVRRDPEVFSRNPRFVTWSVHDFNKWQTKLWSGTFYSAIVFSLHTCVPFTGKRLRGPAMVTKGGLKS